MPTAGGTFPGLNQSQINALIAAYAAPISHTHAAGDIASGQLALARGGLNADLSATGAATHFLRQASAGAAVTVGGIASADIATALTTPGAIGGTTPGTGAFTGLTAGASGVTALQTLIVRDLTATTGRTKLLVRGGAGQLSNDFMLDIQDLNGNTIARSDSVGNFAAISYGDLAAGSPYINFATGSMTIQPRNAATNQFNVNMLLNTVRTTAGSLSSVVTGFTLGRNDSGTPAAGFGADVKFTLESSTTNDRASGYIRSLWNSATDAAAIADMVLIAAYNAGGTVTEREGFRVRGGATEVLTAINGATPVARAAHIADPTGGATVDAEARTAINAILVVLENFGNVLAS